MRFHKSPVVAGVKHAYYSSGAAPGQGRITITVRRAGLTPYGAAILVRIFQMRYFQGPVPPAACFWLTGFFSCKK